MRRLNCLVLIFFSMVFVFILPMAPAPAKSPDVPITYPGDTDKTIARRAQWVTGAKAEGELIWWGSLTPKLANQMIAKFNEIYPFIKVTFWRAGGEELGPRMENDFRAGKKTVDVCLGGEPYNYPHWRKMGMLGKFTDIIPQIEGMDKRMYSKYGDWAIAGNNAVTPQFNAKLVSPAAAPKSWEDLLDPQWKGKLGMTTDMKVWMTLALEEGGWGIEKTENFLTKLGQQQPIWARGHTAGHQLLIAGEFPVMVEEYWYHAWQSQQKGAPVEWVRVQPVPITGSSFNTQKNAPHPNAAKLFLEWQFSPQGLALFEDVIGKGAAFPGSGTKVAKALAGLPLVIRTEEGEIQAIKMGLDKKFAKILGILTE